MPHVQATALATRRFWTCPCATLTKAVRVPDSPPLTLAGFVLADSSERQCFTQPLGRVKIRTCALAFVQRVLMFFIGSPLF